VRRQDLATRWYEASGGRANGARYLVKRRVISRQPVFFTDLSPSSPHRDFTASDAGSGLS